MNNSLPNVINSNFCIMIKNELIQNLINDNLYTDKTEYTDETDVSVIAGYTLETNRSVRLMVLIDNTPLIELSISPYSSDTTSDICWRILRAYEKKYRKS